MSRFDVSVVGLYILDVLGRPVTAIPEGGNVDFIDEIRLTVAGTAGGTAVDLDKLARWDQTKRQILSSIECSSSASTALIWHGCRVLKPQPLS